MNKRFTTTTFSGSTSAANAETHPVLDSLAELNRAAVIVDAVTAIHLDTNIRLAEQEVNFGSYSPQKYIVDHSLESDKQDVASAVRNMSVDPIDQLRTQDTNNMNYVDSLAANEGPVITESASGSDPVSEARARIDSIDVPAVNMFGQLDGIAA